MTVVERQVILEDYLERHDGVFEPADFVDEASDPDHPAHKYFEWNDNVAARRYRLDQARSFVSDLRVQRKQHTSVLGNYRTVMMPVVVSDGKGSYRRTASALTQIDMCQEGIRRLQEWANRYQCALQPESQELLKHLHEDINTTIELLENSGRTERQSSTATSGTDNSGEITEIRI